MIEDKIKKEKKILNNTCLYIGRVRDIQVSKARNQQTKQTPAEPSENFTQKNLNLDDALIIYEKTSNPHPLITTIEKADYNSLNPFFKHWAYKNYRPLTCSKII